MIAPSLVRPRGSAAPGPKPFALALLRTLGAAFLALGCAVDAVGAQAEPTGDEIRGYLRISEKVGPSTERADALSVFVRFPDGAESPDVLSALGVDVRLPDAGVCEFGERTAPRAASDSPLSAARVELVLADWVALRFERPGEQSEEHILAPRAFPTIGRAVGGALYTSRTRRAEDLPPGVKYELSVRGLADQEDHKGFAFRLPETLRDITVSGIALSELSEVRAGRPLDVTWIPEDHRGEPDERRIVVELGDATQRARCVFSESEGLGTIGRDLLSNASRLSPPVSVSILKLARSRARSNTQGDTLDVLFEAETSQIVQIVP